jgi:3-hydroxyethyl bacteriochlorophyllide a dehydrogenase
MDATHGVLLALAATALHGVDIAGDITGKRVLVLGQGPVGQIAARIALARGAEVVVVDRVASRLALAQASQIVDVSGQSLAEQKIAPCEVIIEASGSMAALTSILSALANNGRVVLLGYYDEIQLPYMPLFLKQAQLLTAKEWAPGDLQRCRDMIVSGDLHVAPLLTHIQHIDNLQAAYHVALSDLDCLKLLLTW